MSRGNTPNYSNTAHSSSPSRDLVVAVTALGSVIVATILLGWTSGSVSSDSHLLHTLVGVAVFFLAMLVLVMALQQRVARLGGSHHSPSTRRFQVIDGGSSGRPDHHNQPEDRRPASDASFDGGSFPAKRTTSDNDSAR